MRTGTYIVVPGLLNVLDWCDGFSFLLERFSVFGCLDLGLSLGLLLSGFGLLLLGLGGRRRCRSRHRGLGVRRHLCGGWRKRASCSGSRLLGLRLHGLGALLSRRFVERALLTGRRLVTGRARRLVLGGGMGDGQRRVVEAAAGHEPLGLAVETQPLLFLQHTGATEESLLLSFSLSFFLNTEVQAALSPSKYVLANNRS